MCKRILQKRVCILLVRLRSAKLELALPSSDAGSMQTLNAGDLLLKSPSGFISSKIVGRTSVHRQRTYLAMLILVNVRDVLHLSSQAFFVIHLRLDSPLNVLFRFLSVSSFPHDKDSLCNATSENGFETSLAVRF
jgi:hypothetical protein